MKRWWMGLVMLGAALAATPAHAFDWNGKTATHELDVFDGRMRIVSGHPLATARAFRLAAAEGAGDAETMAALEALYGSDLATDRSDAMQTVLFGSWLNEVRTNMDMGGSLPMEWAARYLRWRYARYLDGRVHSDRWEADTGYSSSNYQHSMMVTSIDPAQQLTQDDVFALIQEYVQWALVAAVMNLIVAQQGLAEGSLDEDDADLNWVSGLRYVGSIFHLIEDSSVSCTPQAQELVPSCVPGDGHTIIDADAEGRWQVVTLSDNHFYERHTESGDKPHGLLDDLYREETIDAIYGDFDPALVNARLLVRVARAVRAASAELSGIPLYDAAGEPNAEFDSVAFHLARVASEEIWDEVIGPRYAAPEDRQALPPLPGGDAPADGWGGDPEPQPAGVSAGCDASGARDRDSWPIVWLGVVLGGAAIAMRRRRLSAPDVRRG